ncbi:uncharacterized protein LOC113393684 [Vanessa tameamea]|uniref:Uncharacterized protein LOC113393684 n=1 Tax=Vanessa tameamea TaxID=334116 RepID=A0ABM4AL53_VANTA
MEDLTPTKKVKRERNVGHLAVLKSPGLHGVDAEQAAARISKFMLVVSWRRRREEIRCVRKTLEFQVSCSERLRIQVITLKSLLDSDNAKVRLAIKELERLKQLLKEKDLEKAILEKEKIALEKDVCAAEDRASEISVGWRSCRSELEHVRAAAASSERALALERDALADARARCDRACRRIAILEDDLSHHETLLSASEAQVTILRNDINNGQKQLDRAREELRLEREAHAHCSRERSALSTRVALSALQTSTMSTEIEQMRTELTRLERELKTTREQLDWWPRPLTRMLGVARTWIRRPMSISDAVIWILIPARHGF